MSRMDINIAYGVSVAIIIALYVIIKIVRRVKNQMRGKRQQYPSGLYPCTPMNQAEFEMMLGADMYPNVYPEHTMD